MSTSGKTPAQTSKVLQRVAKEDIMDDNDDIKNNVVIPPERKETIKVSKPK